MSPMAGVMDRIALPPNPQVEALSFNVTVFGERDSKEVMKAK